VITKLNIPPPQKKKTGPHDEGHETIWWNPKVNTESRCPECGQVFHLKKNPHAHHHDDGHGHH